MSVSVTAWSGHDVGGRPIGLRARKKALTLDLIRLIGPDRLTPLVSESIHRAADLVAMAAEARQRLTNTASAAELLAIIGLEDAADKAIDRLGLSVGLPDPHGSASIPQSITTVANVAA
jgi:hypothetical protein